MSDTTLSISNLAGITHVIVLSLEPVVKSQFQEECAYYLPASCRVCCGLSTCPKKLLLALTGKHVYLFEETCACPTNISLFNI